MTTVLAVKKDGKVVVGADTLVTWGDTRKPFVDANFSKLKKLKSGILGFCGDGAHGNALDLFLSKYKFPSANKVNKNILFNFCTNYLDFLYETITFVSDDTVGFKSLCSMIFANKYGIWQMDSRRCITEVNRFIAIGSGCDYSLGAAQVLYDSFDAKTVVEKSLQSACYFDIYSDLPLEIIEL